MNAKNNDSMNAKNNDLDDFSTASLGTSGHTPSCIEKALLKSPTNIGVKKKIADTEEVGDNRRSNEARVSGKAKKTTSTNDERDEWSKLNWRKSPVPYKNDYMVNRAKGGLEQNIITEASPGTHSKQPSTKERPTATSKHRNAKKQAQAMPASDAEVAKCALWTAADEGSAGSENTTADSAKVATHTEVYESKNPVCCALDGAKSVCAPMETVKCGQTPHGPLSALMDEVGAPKSKDKKKKKNRWEREDGPAHPSVVWAIRIHLFHRFRTLGHACLRLACH